jgi:hypothetical protein
VRNTDSFRLRFGSKRALKMNEQTSAKPPARLFHLDNLRVYLTILVILHHTAIAYGAGGDWSIVDPAVDDISPIFLTFFTAVNQSYFMSAYSDEIDHVFRPCRPPVGAKRR